MDPLPTAHPPNFGRISRRTEGRFGKDTPSVAFILRWLHPPLASSSVAFESLRQRRGVTESLVDWVPEALEGTVFIAIRYR